MTTHLSSAALAIAGLCFSSLWEGALVVTAVWLLLRVLPHRDAATCYAIWLCALTMLVAVPVYTAWAPAWHFITTNDEPAQNDARPIVVAHAGTPVIQTAVNAAPAFAASQAGTSVSAPRISISQALAYAVAFLWLLAAGARLLIFLRDLRQLEIIRRSAQLWSAASAFPIFVSEKIEVPIAIGFSRPAIVLPYGTVARNSESALEAIVLHEIAHLRRRDVWTNAFSRSLEMLLVLNPLAYLVQRRLAAEREIACDDWVVAHLGGGEIFARVLAQMALSHNRLSLAAPSAIGTRHNVVQRIERLLERTPRHLRLSLPALCGVAAFLVVMAVVLQSISPVLAYPEPASPKAEVAAAGCQVHDRPVEMAYVLDTSKGRETLWQPPPPVSAIEKVGGTGKIAILDVTVDRTGKARNVSVVSTPDAQGAAFGKQRFEMAAYRAAIVKCVAVNSRVRVWYPVLSRLSRVYSLVSASYPQSWSQQHPSSCGVPPLIHDGIPQLADIPSAAESKKLRAVVHVSVDQNGQVTEATVMQTSGAPRFDAATLWAARSATYPLNGATGFKPIRPSGASLQWNATHSYTQFSKCSPLPTQYVWSATFEPAGTPLVGF